MSLWMQISYTSYFQAGIGGRWPLFRTLAYQSVVLLLRGYARQSVDGFAFAETLTVIPAKSGDIGTV